MSIEEKRAKAKEIFALLKGITLKDAKEIVTCFTKVLLTEAEEKAIVQDLVTIK